MGAGWPGTFAKQIKLILAIILCAGLCACDINAGKRPYDYSPARWVCKEPNVWFEVDEEKQCYGEVHIGEKTIRIALFFESGSGVQILPIEAVEQSPIDGTHILWSGQAKFSKTKMTLCKATYNELFPDDNMEITFVRQGEPEK